MPERAIKRTNVTNFGYRCTAGSKRPINTAIILTVIIMIALLLILIADHELLLNGYVYETRQTRLFAKALFWDVSSMNLFAKCFKL
jgi:hypothetical protein